ncbi:MAG: hypothetical protein ACLQVY_17150 [Limisphaerales bacterium]
MMAKKSAYVFLTVVLALTALFVNQQRTLNSLRAGNGFLRKQVAAAESARVPVAPETLAEPVAKLNEADEKELLQLRSKIAALREQVRDTSNELALLRRLPTSH